MRDFTETAKILEEMYEKTFSGKKGGRFTISKTLFKELCQRKHLHTSFLNSVVAEALEQGIVVIPLENEIAVVTEEALKNCRRVPEDIVAEYHEDDDAEDWEDDEEFDEEFRVDDEEEEDD